MYYEYIMHVCIYVYICGVQRCLRTRVCIYCLVLVLKELKNEDVSLAMCTPSTRILVFNAKVP